MPFPSPHYYYSFGGTLGTTEEWSTGLRLSDFTGPTDKAGEEAALAEVAAIVNTAWADNLAPVASNAALTWHKYNLIGTDGRYVNQYTNVLDQAAVVPIGSPKYPLQVAIVVTLQTTAARGLASTGRMYLPSPDMVISAPDMVMAPSQAQAVADWAGTLLTAINNAPLSGSVMVMSSGSKVPGRDPAGVARAVTGVNCGTVLDTMRSRRASLLENRSVAAVTGGDGTGGSF